MNIAFVDLKKQFRALEGEMRAAVDKVFEHARFIMGPEIGQLETELARYVGTRHAVACSSGTDALLLPLLAYGVGPGDAVFTSPFTFVATAEVVSLLGATPVFVDIDPETFNLDPEKLKDAFRAVEREGRLRPAGIIPVDLFGLPAEYDPIMALAEAHDLFVIEDAAQSFGGLYHGRPAGSMGHVGATSFFPAKPIGCYGDGGALFTDDDEMVERIRSARIHGQGRDKYENVRLGINGRLDTIQAAVLMVKMTAFPGELEQRRRIAERYNQGLAGHVRVPMTPEGMTSAWACYSVLTERRDEVTAALQKDGVPTAIYYPLPLHLQKTHENLGYAVGDFPAAEDAARRIFSLPIHPYLEDAEVEYIIARVIDAVSSRD